MEEKKDCNDNKDVVILNIRECDIANFFPKSCKLEILRTCPTLTDFTSMYQCFVVDHTLNATELAKRMYFEIPAASSKARIGRVVVDRNESHVLFLPWLHID